MTTKIYIGSQLLPDISQRDGAFHFLIGVILNQQISGEQAWRGVAALADRITLTATDVAMMGPDEVRTHISRSPAVHPFASAMAFAIYEAGEQVVSTYSGDARNIWRESADERDLLRRFSSFRQVGNHKAQVAHYLLVAGYGALPAHTTNRHVAALCPSLERKLVTH